MIRRISILRWAGAVALAVCVGAGAQAAVDRSPTWASLTPAQQQSLAPLQRDWASIEPNRKQKWIEIAAKFPSMPAEERARLQARMAEWARLSPAERADARLQFQEARRVPAEERQAKWQAYQALSPEERDRLAQKAKPPVKPASASEATIKAKPSPADSLIAKRNVVPPAGAPARVVAPTVVQAKPGATTTSMSTRATPPAHHQPGLPKIAATPGYVDPATLLPRRGPQGAAVRAAASADPAEQP